MCLSNSNISNFVNDQYFKNKIAIFLSSLVLNKRCFKISFTYLEIAFQESIPKLFAIQKFNTAK